MPSNQSALISAESQKATPSPLVILYELDLTKWGQGVARFTNQPKSNNEPIIFRGETFQVLPIEITGFETSGTGAPGRPTVTMASSASIVSLIIGCHDLIGATLTRVKTYECFLDDGDTPNPEAIFQIDVYRVERKTMQNRLQVSFEITSILDQEGAYLPRCQALKNYCFFVYRYWDKTQQKFIYDEHDPCPYMGSKYFDHNGASTSMQFDVCGKTLHDCQIRFGNKVQLPYGGFPGMEKL